MSIKYRHIVKPLLLGVTSAACCVLGSLVFAADNNTGIGSVATQAIQSLSGVAKLITAGSYVAGMGFAIGAIAGFKKHKDNPTQAPLSTPIALMFVGAALMFAPSVFKTTGSTLFSSGQVAGVSGVTEFGAKKTPK